MFTLHHGPPVVNSLKCLIVLAEKSVTFQSRYIDILTFEQHEPGFLAVNPDGQVPALEHEGRIVTDSTVINEYIEDVVTDGVRLRPGDPYSVAVMRWWNKYIDEQIFESVSMTAWQAFMGQHVEGFAPDRWQALVARIPTARQRAKWRAAREGFQEADLSRALDKVVEAAERIEAQLGRTPWLAGDVYTLADVNFYSVAGSHWSQVFPEHLSDSRYPRTADWASRVAARPAVKAAESVTPNAINF